jgi:hypothetical protein
MTLPVLNMPSDPPDKALRTVMRIWEKAVDEYVKRKMYLQENLKTLYHSAGKLEARDTYNKMSEEADLIKLLKEICALVYNFQVINMRNKPCTEANEGSTYCCKTNTQLAKYT